MSIAFSCFQQSLLKSSMCVHDKYTPVATCRRNKPQHENTKSSLFSYVNKSPDGSFVRQCLLILVFFLDNLFPVTILSLKFEVMLTISFHGKSIRRCGGGGEVDRGDHARLGVSGIRLRPGCGGTPCPRRRPRTAPSCVIHAPRPAPPHVRVSSCLSLCLGVVSWLQAASGLAVFLALTPVGEPWGAKPVSPPWLCPHPGPGTHCSLSAPVGGRL